MNKIITILVALVLLVSCTLRDHHTITKADAPQSKIIKPDHESGCGLGAVVMMLTFTKAAYESIERGYDGFIFLGHKSEEEKRESLIAENVYNLSLCEGEPAVFSVEMLKKSDQRFNDDDATNARNYLKENVGENWSHMQDEIFKFCKR